MRSCYLYLLYIHTHTSPQFLEDLDLKTNQVSKQTIMIKANEVFKNLVQARLEKKKRRQESFNLITKKGKK